MSTTLPPWQKVVAPEAVIAADGPADTVTANACAALEPQLLTAATVIFPPAAPAVAVMLLVVLVPVHPEGSVHVYDVAPVTAGVVYVWLLPAHSEVEPEMDKGWEGVVEQAAHSAILFADTLPAVENTPPA